MKHLTAYVGHESVRLNGSGEDYSLSVGMKIASGPSGVINRPCTLVLSVQEAFRLVMDLLNQLPAAVLERDRNAEYLILLGRKLFEKKNHPAA